MTTLTEFFNFHPIYASWGVIILGSIFSCAWYMDHLTHKKIWEEDITDSELRTHRMILYASWGLQLSLALFAVNRFIALPIFIGSLITRFVHEAIDELKFHVDRCDERETLIHLVMWLTINSGTALVFLWGFFFQYKGFSELPIYHYILWGIIFIVMGYIGNREIMDYKGKERKSGRTL